MEKYTENTISARTVLHKSLFHHPIENYENFDTTELYDYNINIKRHDTYTVECNATDFFSFS